ncbi:MULTISPECIES: class II D-tagatose-bisphosphate aldolase, non-catalytic subunit [Terrabacteria group]|uniref:class II D-tagatose-bisphosphate aldolase, non-catalytic subunit n=1 Tax=Bacillati TaxID=1783272 RepID=UPI001C9360CF|nr:MULTISPECIES: class II D-tagatose-bisphosphate aldolase, non-catalytic subunit [Terrabacteria group]
MIKHPLMHLIDLQKAGQAVGIYSACTANPLVIRACLQKAKETHSILLVEATANQVDQYGGYTGMKPADFIEFVQTLAKEENFDSERILFGGDHLGPLTFAHHEEEKALQEAEELIRQYVLAGFTKIHIDTSMKVAGDPVDVRLSDEIIASRGARLAKIAEAAYQERIKKFPNSIHPVYVVGSEVPIPGGSQEAVDTGIQVTKVADFKNTVATFEKAFPKESWPYVIAVVVQPGVEEKDAGCTDYDRLKAVDLMASIKDYANLVFEGHSTDYQTQYHLREMVEDGVGILKVGPGLTYAAREALFALAYAEKEVYKAQTSKQSHFMEVLEEEMLKNPKYFVKHYHGTEDEISYKRKFSFSDRSRYYLPQEPVQKAIAVLLENFKGGVPYGVLSQFLPREYTAVRAGQLKNEPMELIKAHVGYTIDEYLYASHQEQLG